MTDLIFGSLEGDVFAFSINNNKIVRIVDSKGMATSLEGLKFNMSGIVKEHPDLKGKPFDEMRKIALQRLYEKLNTFKTEKELTQYIKEEMEKFGNKLIMIKKKGFRPIKVK